VTERSGELLRVLYEIEERVHDVDISARDRERIRLSFVDQVEFEGVVVLWLRGPADSISDRPELIIQGGRVDNFALGFQFRERLLPELQLLILRLFVISGGAAGRDER